MLQAIYKDMLMNQISTKDLFSTNPGAILGSRYDLSDSGLSANSQSNSQSLNSQVEFSQISSGDGYSQQISNLSQTSMSPCKSYFQRYMAKGPLFGPKDSQSTMNSQAMSVHSKTSFKEQLQINKQRARERDERELLYTVVASVKECEKEVKGTVSEMKEILSHASAADKRSLNDCLQKFQESLLKQQEEICSILKTREENKNKITELEKELAAKTSLLAEMEHRVHELDSKRTDRIVSELRLAYSDQHDRLIKQLSQQNTDQIQHIDSIHQNHSQQLGQQNKHFKMVSEKQNDVLHQLGNRLEDGLQQAERSSHIQQMQLQNSWQAQLEKLQSRQSQELQNVVLRQIENTQKTNEEIRAQRLQELHHGHKQELMSLLNKQLSQQNLQLDAKLTQNLQQQSQQNMQLEAQITQNLQLVQQQNSQNKEQIHKKVLHQIQQNSGLILERLTDENREEMSGFNPAYASEQSLTGNVSCGYGNRESRSLSVDCLQNPLYGYEMLPDQQDNVDLNRMMYPELNINRPDFPSVSTANKWTSYGKSANNSVKPAVSVVGNWSYEQSLGVEQGGLHTTNTDLCAKTQSSTGMNSYLPPPKSTYSGESSQRYNQPVQCHSEGTASAQTVNRPPHVNSMLLVSPNLSATLYSSKSLFSKANPSPVATVIPQVHRVEPVLKNGVDNDESVYDFRDDDQENLTTDEPEQEDIDIMEDQNTGTRNKKKRKGKGRSKVPSKKPNVQRERTDHASRDTTMASTAPIKQQTQKNKPVLQNTPVRRSNRLAECEVRTLRSGVKIKQDDSLGAANFPDKEQKTSKATKASKIESKNSVKKAKCAVNSSKIPQNETPKMNRWKEYENEQIEAHAPVGNVLLRSVNKTSRQNIQAFGSIVDSLTKKLSSKAVDYIDEEVKDSYSEPSQSLSMGFGTEDQFEYTGSQDSSPSLSVTEVAIKRRTKTPDNPFASPVIVAENFSSVSVREQHGSAQPTAQDGMMSCRRDTKKRKLFDGAITSSQLWALTKPHRK